MVSHTGKSVQDIYNVIGGVGRIVYADNGEPFTLEQEALFNRMPAIQPLRIEAIRSVCPRNDRRAVHSWIA